VVNVYVKLLLDITLILWSVALSNPIPAIPTKLLRKLLPVIVYRPVDSQSTPHKASSIKELLDMFTLYELLLTPKTGEVPGPRCEVTIPSQSSPPQAFKVELFIINSWLALTTNEAPGENSTSLLPNIS
jgi:hypothetical protein